MSRRIPRKNKIHVSAYDDLGRTLVSGLEVLHMCDREAALKTALTLLPIKSEAEDFIHGLEGVGAIALARDLKERAKTNWRTPRKGKRK